MSDRTSNGELHEGATDGKYRKIRPNTTVAKGLGDELVIANRRSLHPFFNYGFIDTEETNMVSPGEARVKSSPVPSFSNTPVADIDNYMMGQTH